MVKLYYQPFICSFGSAMLLMGPQGLGRMETVSLLCAVSTTMFSSVFSSIGIRVLLATTPAGDPGYNLLLLFVKIDDLMACPPLRYANYRNLGMKITKKKEWELVVQQMASEFAHLWQQESIGADDYCRVHQVASRLIPGVGPH
jgi:hypothetical protein